MGTKFIFSWQCACGDRSSIFLTVRVWGQGFYFLDSVNVGVGLSISWQCAWARDFHSWQCARGGRVSNFLTVRVGTGLSFFWQCAWASIFLTVRVGTGLPFLLFILIWKMQARAVWCLDTPLTGQLQCPICYTHRPGPACLAWAFTPPPPPPPLLRHTRRNPPPCMGSHT